ncbi:hypothetical protein HELRODRAFT_169359 [Helobdella robusta]|uniref:Uncharacterized protein n=1 Tax=Helobdella robusta TaxID=6412 RepID=T1F1U3_HELRO|nr:hypothetical protein HELRODRAFT_169359 [Helobdella robusta]ESO08502.1 hypothetical protein HELRODRAFT_169359 [Helobdella robusta]
MTNELSNVYIDEDGNLQFGNQYLEEIEQKQASASGLMFLKKNVYVLILRKMRKKIEILRLFMDKSCADWYSSMIIKLTLNSEWSIWKNKFCKSFANQGWNQVTYALLFKYKDGSLVDYAIKKEKLLLDMRTSIDTGTLVDLIAAGLPGFVLEKINRQSMEDTVDLFNEVRKYEHLMNKNKNGAYTRYENQKIYNKIEERT